MNADRILVVDDEDAIREIVSSMLSSAGFRCTQASSGVEALAILESVILVLVFKYIVQLRPGILIRLRVFPEEKILAARGDA